MSLHTVNIEQGMPTVATARIRLDQALRTARTGRVRVVKVIHGYGSSGSGGAIKRDVKSFLAEKQRSGVIVQFVSGEEFSPFSPAARRILDACPQLSRDRDYCRQNHGVTFILLK